MKNKRISASLLVASAVSMALVGCGNESVNNAPSQQTPQVQTLTVNDAKAYVVDAEKRLAELYEYAAKAEWVAQTYITEDTQFIASKANEEIKEENISKNNLAIHKYRIPPDKFTEIDFYLPKEKVGFCVTNLSRKNRFRIDNKKINEFDSLKGICPHCKAEDQYSDLCESCGRVPEEITNPKCSLCGQPPTKEKTKHYFYRLTNFGDSLSRWLDENKHLQKDVKKYVSIIEFHYNFFQ